MTPDQLRTGAALVRALVADPAGDIRFIVADWIEEYGLPGSLPSEIARILNWLRHHRHSLVVGCFPACVPARFPFSPRPWIGTTHPLGYGSPPLALGTWPAEAWSEGVTP